jgi:hypothetical protein
MKKKRCRHCKTLFWPDIYNATRQNFCCKSVKCRKASKKDSQKRWLEKPENQDYFRGSQNVKHVQNWRKSHPGYWRRKSSKQSSALQETLTPELAEDKPDTAKLELGVLQDIKNAQPLILLGLIANITGIALQDHLDIAVRRLLQLGIDVSNHSNHSKGEHHDTQAAHFPTTSPKGSQTVQLAGSPVGP